MILCGQFNSDGEVGPDKPICFEAIKSEFDKLGPYVSQFRLVVNSAGGNITEAHRIYRLLRDHPALITADIGDVGRW